MAITDERVIGRRLNITAGGALTLWDTVSANIKWNTADATASDSTLDETVLTTGMVEGDATGFLGAENNGGTLPLPGADLSDFAAEIGADSVFPDLSQFTNIKVTEVNYSLTKDPAKFSFKFRSGVLNTTTT